MAGHFALGNTNTLATIDVAGAFIVITPNLALLINYDLLSLNLAIFLHLEKTAYIVFR